MASNLETAYHALALLRAGLSALTVLGVERRRALEIIDRAEAEGREPTIAELRAELGDLDVTLDELENRLDDRADDPT